MGKTALQEGGINIQGADNHALEREMALHMRARAGGETFAGAGAERQGAADGFGKGRRVARRHTPAGPLPRPDPHSGAR